MNNQVKLTDADKLKVWLNDMFKVNVKFKNVAKAEVYKCVLIELEAGTFDPDTPPVPTIKNGELDVAINQLMGSVAIRKMSIASSIRLIDDPETTDEDKEGFSEAIAEDEVEIMRLEKAIAILNSHSADPVPTIKPGDKVRHKERGKGTVLWALSDHASVQFKYVIKICKIKALEVVE